jgi:hypothetical protein
MNLTYENMMAVAERYCDMMEPIDPRQDPNVRNKVRELFASDFVVRFGDPARFQNREEWMEQLCGHADRYRVKVIHKPLPYYIIVDERKKLAACFVKEQWKHPGTGEVFTEFLLNMHLEFVLDGDAVKLRKMLLSRVPSVFQIDTLAK